MLTVKSAATTKINSMFAKPRMLPAVENKRSSLCSILRNMNLWVDHSSNIWDIEIHGNVLFHLRVANTPELRRRAFRLGKELYQGAHYASDDGSDLLCSRFDTHADTLTLIIFDDAGREVGTATIIKDHPTRGLPIDQTFQNEANQLRSEGKQSAELVRLAIDPNIRGSQSREILIHLLNFGYIYAKQVLHCDGFLITVNPRHELFYARALGYKRMGEVKPCPKVKNAPAALLYLCFAYASDRVAKETGRAPQKNKRGALYPYLYAEETEPLIARFLKAHHKSMTHQEAVTLGLAT